MGNPTKFSLFLRVRIAVICTVGLLLLILVEPHLFRFAIWEGVTFQAARHGVHLEIGSVEGSLYEPVVFHDIWLISSHSAVVSKTSINSAEVAFSWRSLLMQKGRGFFDRLSLEGVHADVALQPYAETGPEPIPAQVQSEFEPWLPAPTLTEVSNSSFRFHLGNRTIDYSDARFTVHSSKPGVIAIERLTLEQGSIARTFTKLRGTTALQGTRLRVADITLSEGVVLKSLSCDLEDLTRGQLQVDFEFAAFGGSLGGELLNTSLGRLPIYDIVGYFSNISVEALGQFLNAPEKAGGLITEGRFTFRGSPQDLENATVSTRFEARDFRWGARQWNSLVLGVTVVNHRVQIPELELQQAHNTLRLKGELALPGEETPWWLSAFSFDITAKFDNLTELSALVGPRFADAAGKLTVDGSIRGDKKAYSGQLLIAGSKLAWRGVPFDLFNAGIKLDGNELQILNLEATHGTDFVRGKGVVSILGERRYQGELNASIEELAAYSPLLQKPIVPAPPGGGLVVNWSGDGTATTHSGAFTAHFRKLRTLNTPEVPATLPVDADLVGTYAPGGLSLSKCVLANDEIRLEGQLAANEKTLKLEGIKLTQNKVPWLEGDATLPFNLFQWWVNPSLAALSPDAPFVARLSAKGIQLEEVAHLTGRQIPVRGLLTGTVKTESTLRNLRVTGAVRLTKGQLPATEWVPALDKLEAEAEIDGNVLRLSKFSASHPWGNFSATGSLDFSKFDATAFDLLVHGEKVRFNAGPDWAGSANLDVTVTGTRDAANVTGAAEIATLETTPRPHFGALITSGNPETIRVPAPAINFKAPFDRWNYNVGVTTSEPVSIKEGSVSAALRFAGTGSPLTATGSVTFAGLPAGTSYTIGKLESGTWQLGENPFVVAHLSGKFICENSIQKFDGYFIGPPDHLASTFSGQRPEDDELIRIGFTPGAKPLPPEIATLPLDVKPLVSIPLLPIETGSTKEAQAVSQPIPPPPPKPMP
ncbi:MAG: hypothetical protein NTZ46_06560 [Verrucomicrobia bacterium]|nr:hypothetical protein [Verrucomicrobiota bacterium]